MIKTGAKSHWFLQVLLVNQNRMFLGKEWHYLISIV